MPRCAAAAVVVDAKAAAHIEEAHRCAQRCQLHIQLAGLLQGVFQHGDVADLAADVKVQQTQVAEQIGFA